MMPLLTQTQEQNQRGTSELRRKASVQLGGNQGQIHEEAAFQPSPDILAGFLQARSLGYLRLLVPLRCALPRKLAAKETAHCTVPLGLTGNRINSNTLLPCTASSHVPTALSHAKQLCAFQSTHPPRTTLFSTNKGEGPLWNRFPYLTFPFGKVSELLEAQRD